MRAVARKALDLFQCHARAARFNDTYTSGQRFREDSCRPVYNEIYRIIRSRSETNAQNKQRELVNLKIE